MSDSLPPSQPCGSLFTMKDLARSLDTGFQAIGHSSWALHFYTQNFASFWHFVFLRYYFGPCTSQCDFERLCTFHRSLPWKWCWSKIKHTSPTQHHRDNSHSVRPEKLYCEQKVRRHPNSRWNFQKNREVEIGTHCEKRHGYFTKLTPTIGWSKIQMFLYPTIQTMRLLLNERWE